MADSVLIGGSLPSALEDSETPIKAAPQICRAVVTTSMEAKTVHHQGRHRKSHRKNESMNQIKRFYVSQRVTEKGKAVEKRILEKLNSLHNIFLGDKGVIHIEEGRSRRIIISNPRYKAVV